MIPVTIVDDFLEQPDEWRDFALNLEYESSKGTYPGSRSRPLEQINRHLSDKFMLRFLSLFFDPRPADVIWKVTSLFQKSPADSSEGWIHRDSNLITAILYLNPDADINAGTSLYKPKKGQIWSMIHDNVRIDHNLGRITAEQAEPYRQEYNSQFEETVRVGNVYNRLVAFPGNHHHAANVLNCNNEERITLNFFIDSVVGKNVQLPLIKMNCF